MTCTKQNATSNPPQRGELYNLSQKYEVRSTQHIDNVYTVYVVYL